MTRPQSGNDQVIGPSSEAALYRRWEQQNGLVWVWAGRRRDMALEGSWWFQKPHDDAGAAACVYALRRSPKLWARFKRTSFGAKMSKNGAAICMEMWKTESDLSCDLTVERTQLFSPPSIRWVVSRVWTWVSWAWLAPDQTEVKPRTVHAISTKREKSEEGRHGQTNLRLWGVVFSDNPRGRKTGELPRGLFSETNWLAY